MIQIVLPCGVMILHPTLFIRVPPTNVDSTRMPPRKLSSKESGAELGNEKGAGGRGGGPLPEARFLPVMPAMRMMMLWGSN